MKITIDGFVDKSATAYAAVPGDYVGEDGLLYCGKCHTPKQHRIVFMGEKKRPVLPANVSRKKRLAASMK